MLDMNIHPSALNLVQILALNPIKENWPSGLRLTSLLRIVKVFIHSTPKVVRETDIYNDFREGG